MLPAVVNAQTEELRPPKRNVTGVVKRKAIKSKRQLTVEDMLRQAENRVRIEGILSEINLKYGSFVKNGATVDTIGGNIKVLVHQTINNVDITLEIPVYMFAPKLTNAGKSNPAFESIEKVMTEFTSIASGAGEAGADKIRITNGNIRMNEYYNQQGQL